MHSAHVFLQTLALVLCAAAATTVLFQRLRQPVVLGYLLAGMVIGPYVPIPLEADRQVVQTLAELGVVLLMFSLGIEFSLPKLLARRADGRFRGGGAVQPDDLAGLPGGAGLRLVAAGELLRRGGHFHLQHHDHRQGLPGAADQGRFLANRLWRANRRGPDRHFAVDRADGAFDGRRTWRRPVGHDRGPPGPVSLRADRRRLARDSAIDEDRGQAGTIGNDRCGERRHRLRIRAAGGEVRLLRRARRVHRRQSGGRIRRGKDGRASRRTGARHLRRGLFRLGGHADQSRRTSPPIGWPCSCSSRRSWWARLAP